MRIGILGRVADGIDLFDGQTIKTRILRDELKKKFPESEIVCLDTYEFKKHLIKNAIGLVSILKQCDCIFVLLAANGRKVCFPLIYYLNKFFKKPIYHDAIGGLLAEETKKNKRCKKYISSFSINWVELPSLKENLKKLGVNNVDVLPNFKDIKILTDDDILEEVPNIFRFCTFSRVTESKGILEAVNSINYVNEKFGKKIAELHIYGVVEDSFREKFERMLLENKNIVFYEGTVEYDKSVQAIKDYFMLLFPSTYISEGFPGTIIDAFSAGLPVIASNWNYNEEIISKNKTGFCYNYRNPQELYDLVYYAINNPKIIIEMKKNCIREALHYVPDNIMKKICLKMKNDLETIHK